MALSHRLGNLQRSPCTVACSKYSLHIGGHVPVNPNNPIFCLQSGEQVSGRHRLAQAAGFVGEQVPGKGGAQVRPAEPEEEEKEAE